MKQAAAEVLFASIKNDETMVKRLAILIERTQSTILEDACAPVATRILIDEEAIKAYLTEKYPGCTFEYKHPIFSGGEITGLEFCCRCPERYTLDKDWQSWLRDPYSLEPTETFTRKRLADSEHHVFNLNEIPSDFYEIKYL